MSDAWPLVGTRVVDLSSGLAGAYCTKLLADGGADVVKVEDPAGDPLRRRSESGAAIPPGEDGAFFRFLSTSKDSVVASAVTDADVGLVHGLLDDAEIVVWSAGTSVADDPRFAPERLWRDAAGRRRHRTEPVRARRAMARSPDHRLHPAGALRRSRAARHSRPPAAALRRPPGGVGRRHLRARSAPWPRCDGPGSTASATSSTSPPSTR